MTRFCEIETCTNSCSTDHQISAPVSPHVKSNCSQSLNKKVSIWYETRVKFFNIFPLSYNLFIVSFIPNIIQPMCKKNSLYWRRLWVYQYLNMIVVTVKINKININFTVTLSKKPNLVAKNWYVQCRYEPIPNSHASWLFGWPVALIAFYSAYIVSLLDTYALHRHRILCYQCVRKPHRKPYSVMSSVFFFSVHKCILFIWLLPFSTLHTVIRWNLFQHNRAWLPNNTHIRIRALPVHIQ